MMKLLCLSNGHGEDVVAVRVLERLRRHPNAPELAALPLVGEGLAYSRSNIPIIGPVQKMPSGGFIYMDGRQLWRDLQKGLLQLTLAQYRVIRQWGQSGGKLLAVGDIVPLLFAWLSGAEYAFIGTAKSEYYLRDERGWLPRTSAIERYFGSVYLPWDRWLLSRERCRAVFPRDKLTAEVLKQWSIPVWDLGNPMMDGISDGYSSRESTSGANILLLPGSRMPEAIENWQKLLQATTEVISGTSDREICFLAAISGGLNLEPFQKELEIRDWQPKPTLIKTPVFDPAALVYSRSNATLVLTQNAYRDCLLAAEVAIAMAGTATEQFVGLGKVAIAMPGNGPQFTPAFAEAQTRLLGPSLILAKHPLEVASLLASLYNEPEKLHSLSENGRRRMGSSGASARIASCLIDKLWQ